MTSKRFKLPISKFCYLLAILSALTCGNSYASEESITVNGYGSDRKRAIADALTQGIRQIKGVSVDSTEVLNSLSIRGSSSQNGEEKSSSQLSIEQSGISTLKTQGLLSRYEVHSLTKQDDMGYQAELTVYILKYEKPGLPADARRKLAILPFHLKNQRFHLLGDSISARLVEEELRNKLIDQFTQSRRMNVLDREFNREFDDEKALWMSHDANTLEKAKLGNVLGVDYLVVGNLRNVSSKKSST
jgi:TolB-like protein